ncbi:Ricin-type beta-trefoil lectin domain-like [Saccharopolyspora kobensis]|uniref:Ricin-type beta-trefoil lectin domain-like n=1 Tax=Saccharopolyspora kobensis TaxID=146035 RepID=A0A1H6DR41_9PSEU|nr:RICIN domain-containing protein [Saccharopolyspora kobensis]SEG87731.1 Ricin-type beta-trefoil lectin domain-like [Saccharopolyspora kobensis]SFE05332.1 Ricin-type beta-trefoil lectin domain-like [Saccharopolyspora kobensis]
MRFRFSAVASLAALLLLPAGGAFSAQADQEAAEPRQTAVRIVNVSSGQKLIPTGYGANKADDIVVWANAIEEAPGGKLWRLQFLGGGYYQIRNVDTNKCLAVGNYNAPDGRTAVVQQECSQAFNQQWDLPPAGNGHLIISRSDGRVVVPFNTGGNYWAVLEQQSGALTQQWNFPPA